MKNRKGYEIVTSWVGGRYITDLQVYKEGEGVIYSRANEGTELDYIGSKLEDMLTALGVESIDTIEGVEYD